MGCMGSSHLPQEMVSLNPDPQDLRMGPYLEGKSWLMGLVKMGSSQNRVTHKSSMTGVLSRREEAEIHRHEDKAMGRRTQGWGGVSTSQGMLRLAGHRFFLLEPPGGTSSAHTLVSDSGFRNLRRFNSVIKHCSLRCLVMPGAGLTLLDWLNV